MVMAFAVGREVNETKKSGGVAYLPSFFQKNLRFVAKNMGDGTNFDSDMRQWRLHGRHRFKTGSVSREVFASV